MPFFEGLAVSAVFGLLQKIFDKDIQLTDKVYEIFIKTEKEFFNRFKDKYRKPSECFLTREENLQKMLSIVFYKEEKIEFDVINPKNYDETPSATKQEFDFLISTFTKLLNIDVELSNLLYTKESFKTIFETLKQTEENGKKLDQLLKQEVVTHTSKKYLTNPPMQETFIVGRDNDLKAVKQKLESDNTLLLMNGLGGIGKTTLARKYLIDFEKDYDHIVWLEISKGVKEAFAGNMILHNNLKLKLAGLKPDESFAVIINELQNMEGDNLLILDDAKEDFEGLKKYITMPNWKVLITSRQKFSNIASHYLDFLTKEAAFELFYKYYQSERNDEILEKILKPVNYHTLVVELFSKMADMNGLSLNELRERANAKGIDISNNTEIITEHSEEIITNILDYLNTTFPIKELPAEKIEILRKLAIIPTDFYSKTVIDFFLQIDEKEKENFTLNLNKLSQMGWIERNKDQYKLHDIIGQLVLKDFPQDFVFYEDYIKLITNICHINQSKDNPLDRIQLMPFGLEILKLVEVENETISRLNDTIASLYNVLGKYQSSVAYYTKALEIAEFISNKNLQNMINGNLALTYADLGQYEKARDLLEASLKSAMENFGEKHPIMAINQSNLALAYQDLGQYEKAQNLLEASLKSNLENFGEKHPAVARTQSNLATVYSNLGQYEKARDLLEATLKSTLENFGEKYPTVARTQSNLATVYQNLGKHEKARDLLEASLKTDLENFGEKHPNVVIRQTNLALVYKDIGQYEKAQNLMETALKSAMENFGEKHPNVAINKSNLAIVYSDLGKYEKARDLLEAALKSDLENFGEKHPNVATRYNNLGQLFLQTKDFDLAMDNLQKALAIAKAVWGIKHPKSQIILRAIFIILKILSHGVITDKDAKAIKQLKKVKTILANDEKDMKNYLDFLVALNKKGIAEEAFTKLKPEYQKIFREVQQEMEGHKFQQQIQKHTLLAIKTHTKKENQLFVLQKHKEKLGENTHPKIIKYYDFLLEYANGKVAEDIKNTINKPLWNLFKEIREGVSKT